MSLNIKERNATNHQLIRVIPKNISIDTIEQNRLNSSNWFKGSRERGLR